MVALQAGGDASHDLLDRSPLGPSHRSYKGVHIRNEAKLNCIYMQFFWYTEHRRQPRPSSEMICRKALLKDFTGLSRIRPSSAEAVLLP